MVRITVRMTQADKIIGKFGGLTATAKALGHTNPTTVQGWKKRGFIPARQQNRVMDAAKKAKLDLSPDDFFDVTPIRKARAS